MENDSGISLRENFDLDQGTLTLFLDGRLDSFTTARVWSRAHAAHGRHRPATLKVDASGLSYCDGTGIALLVSLKQAQESAGQDFQLEALKPEFEKVLQLFASDAPTGQERPRVPKSSFTVEVGQFVVGIWRDFHDSVVFTGEITTVLFQALIRPGIVRWPDAWRAAETAGVNALPIVLLISFLVGLIMAFQGAIPMKMFGAEIYVANLIALSMVRELGPLMTAIVLTGRSASAFAAEIGTMKVNEEIDALKTMGLDPMRFLVLPRVLAAVSMTPLLAVFANLISIMGGSIVLLSMGYSLSTYLNQVIGSITYVDVLGGLFKSFVFGILIAAVGCLRGLQTRTGPSAVGDSTTRSVVSGIVLIVVVDGIFSVIYYYLGL